MLIIIRAWPIILFFAHYSFILKNVPYFLCILPIILIVLHIILKNTLTAPLGKLGSSRDSKWLLLIQLYTISG
jgi:hypothetical protein